MEFDYDGGGVGKGATVTLYVDGSEVGSGRVEQSEGYMFSAEETCDVGVDDASSTSPDYTPETSRFTGTVNWVELAIDEAASADDHYLSPDERFRVAMAIQ
jgi:arylsulfatase